MRGINHVDDWGWGAACRIGIGSAIAGSAALGAGSSLLGSGKSSSASKQAAGQSLEATELSLQEEQNMYNETGANLTPFRDYGQSALPSMYYEAGVSQPGQSYLDQANYSTQAATGYQQQAAQYLNQAAGMTPPSVVTENWLQQTPGYQWQLGQGLKATQAAAAARGLGVSGASLKGAATYATGLADSNYQNQFNNAQTAWQDVINQGQSALNLGSATQNNAAQYLNQASQAQQQQQQTYSQYANIANLGENAAAQTGQAATTTSGQAAQSLATGASQYGNYLQNSGQAQAAGTTGASNAISSGLNNYLAYQNYQNYGGTLGGSTTQYQSGNVSGTQNNADLLQGATYGTGIGAGNVYYN